MGEQEDWADRAARMIETYLVSISVPGLLVRDKTEHIAKIIREESAPFSTGRVLGENSRLQFKIKHLVNALKEIKELPDVDHDHAGTIARDAISNLEGF